jgi:serine/threonine-protein kinase RsbW
LPRKTEQFLLVTPSDSKNLVLIRDLVGKIALRAGFPQDYVDKIQLAVDEACTNVIRHAYPRNRRGDITVRIGVDSRKLKVEVIDHGKGFDVQAVLAKDVNHRLNELKRGGLGIYLMRMLMDEVRFDVKPGKETRVEMVKYRDLRETDEQKALQKKLIEKSHTLRR